MYGTVPIATPSVVRGDARVVSARDAAGVSSSAIFREAEVEHLDPALGRHHDVAGLEIPVDHSLALRGDKGFGHGGPVVDDLRDGESAPSDETREGPSHDELHRQEAHAVLLSTE